MYGATSKINLEKITIGDYGIVENGVFKPYIDTMIFIGTAKWVGELPKQIMSRIIANEEKIHNYPFYEKRDNKNNVIFTYEKLEEDKTNLVMNITHDSDDIGNIGFIPGFKEYARQAIICCDNHEVYYTYSSPYNYFIENLWKPMRDALTNTITPLPEGIEHPINPVMHLSEIKPHYYFPNHAKEAQTTYFICFFNLGIIKLLNTDKTKLNISRQYIESFLTIIRNNAILDKSYNQILQSFLDSYN